MRESIRKSIEKTKNRLDLLEELDMIEAEFRIIKNEFEKRKAELERKIQELDK